MIHKFSLAATGNGTKNLTYFYEANGTSLSLNSATGYVEWFVNSSSFSVKFTVKDENNLAAILVPNIRLCYCLNSGSCDFGTENSVEDAPNNALSYGECSCPSNVTGGFCQTSVPPCEVEPCFVGVICTNNNVNRTADCGPCPTGYTGDGRKCYGR